MFWQETLRCVVLGFFHSTFSFLPGKERKPCAWRREREKNSSAAPSVMSYFIGIYNPLDPLDNF